MQCFLTITVYFIDVVSALEELQIGICYDRIVESHGPLDLSLLNRQNANNATSRKIVDAFTRASGADAHSPLLHSDPFIARQILLDNIQSDGCWNTLDSTQDFSMYCVVGCNPPHLLFKANYKWYSEFGCTPSDVGKMDILEFLTADVGPKTCLQSMHNEDLLKIFSNDLHQNVSSHVLLEFQNKKTGYVGLYSVHYYPILCKRNVGEEDDRDEYELLK